MYPFDGFDAVEVWNGLWSSDRPWNADNEAALAEWGRGLAAGIRSRRWLLAWACIARQNSWITRALAVVPYGIQSSPKTFTEYLT
jgi:hypothetical protein